MDKPSPLYKQFKRLGIYEWPDVLKTARGKLDKEIMAIYFSDTRLFSKPVNLDSIDRILKSHGIKYTLQSPIKLSKTAFKDFYHLGTDIGS